MRIGTHLYIQTASPKAGFSPLPFQFSSIIGFFFLVEVRFPSEFIYIQVPTAIPSSALFLHEELELSAVLLILISDRYMSTAYQATLLQFFSPSFFVFSIGTPL